MVPAKDCRRKEHFLKLVNKVHKIAWSEDSWETCQEAFKIMKEGTANEMERYIAKMVEKAKQQRLEGRSASHTYFVEELCVSAQGGAKMSNRLTEPTPSQHDPAQQQVAANASSYSSSMFSTSKKMSKDACFFLPNISATCPLICNLCVGQTPGAS